MLFRYCILRCVDLYLFGFYSSQCRLYSSAALIQPFTAAALAVYVCVVVRVCAFYVV